MAIELPRDFPALLRWLRQRAGLSQHRLAGLAGINAAYINRMEAAEPAATLVPRERILARLCLSLELTAAERDRLYFAAGRCPPTLSAVGRWDPTVGQVAELIADPDLTDDDRAEFRQVLELLVDRWRRSSRASTT